MKKRIFAFGAAIIAAVLGFREVSALSGGSISCDNLKTTFSASSTEIGAATIILSENCKTDNIYIKKGQIITLDAAGHTLETNINVENGGELTISSFSTPGVVSGVVSNNGKLVINGGKFSFNPDKYLAEGYTSSVENGFYVVSKASGSNISSKVTASNESIKNALVATLTAYEEKPDSSTNNGRAIARLVDAIKQGHTLSASIVINDDPEITEDIIQALLEETAGTNLASVSDIKFVVTDNNDQNLSVSLDELTTPVTVTLPIPAQYKSALSDREIEVYHVISSEDISAIDGADLDGNGDVAFKTSSFSLFAMAYDGDPITASGEVPVPQTSAGGVNNGNATTDSTTTTTPDVVTPDTAGFGFELTVFNLLLIIGVALVILAFVGYGVKRAYVRHRISWK